MRRVRCATKRPGPGARRLLLLVLVIGAAFTAGVEGGFAKGSDAVPPRVQGVRLDPSRADRLVLTAASYRLTLSKRNGSILDLVDRVSGARLTAGSKGQCLWIAAFAEATPQYAGGCLYGKTRRSRFSYRWNAAASTLTMRYRGDPDASQRVDATVTVTAGTSSFDLQATVANRWGGVMKKVFLPADLLVPVREVEAGYTPTYLPGTRLKPLFFSGPAGALFTYPSRWAFADYLALDVSGGHLAVYTVNPPPAPIAPATIGFVHLPPPGACSGASFCLRHAFDTWTGNGDTWTSPVVRVLVGGTAGESITSYRGANGIDAYPSLSDKLGARSNMLSRSPLIKADLWKGLHPFDEWEPELRRLPSPALLHPVSFQPGGHDRSYPDFLPPDPRWGTTEDFKAVTDEARSLGIGVMPYTNVSWWTTDSVTLRTLPPPLTVADITVHDEAGEPVTDHYGPNEGYIVSPFSPFVRERVDTLMEDLRTEVAVDCVFFDQLGARKWIPDFNPAAPTPLAYEDGWLSLLSPYSSRCLMVEDGWDRLAGAFVGFLGGLLEGSRETNDPNQLWGSGTWEPYPLALWLLHDKVLLYQHDLYEGTMTTDLQVLTWNAAFGMMLSYNWDGWTKSLDSPWLDLVGDFQQALGPLYAGKPFTGYREVAPEVTESAFDGATVIADWSDSHGYETGGYGIAPQGFLARSDGDDLVAGVFSGTFEGSPLSAGVHYLIVHRDPGGVTVHQPLGPDTRLTVAADSSWPESRVPKVQAFSRSGVLLGEAEGTIDDGRLSFTWQRDLGGEPVAYYRLTPPDD